MFLMSLELVLQYFDVIFRFQQDFDLELVYCFNYCFKNINFFGVKSDQLTQNNVYNCEINQTKE